MAIQKHGSVIADDADVPHVRVPLDGLPAHAQLRLATLSTMGLAEPGNAGTWGAGPISNRSSGRCRRWRTVRKCWRGTPRFSPTSGCRNR
jgi:hypothetical protein